MENLEVAVSGLVFDVDVAGAAGAPLVLLLHGFPQTSHAYRHELPALASAGFRAVAPNQRGYSPGARPAAVSDYAVAALTRDALNIADHFGAKQFHLVGHDWGGQLAWLIAAQHPERIRSLCVLSRPHPAAFSGAMRDDPAQSQRSRHHRAFQDPDTARKLLEENARRFRRNLRDQQVPDADIDAYLLRLGDERALDAALNWYRAAVSGERAAAVPAVHVPTLYIWGDADATVGRAAAEATARHVDAPYRFMPIEGAGHFLTDDVGERVTAAVVEHVLLREAAK
ncbi:MAG TPA: alpha/beta hydrolase [Polyangiales bacterium]|nr:alpha/beta hydrolase [Polyangiales bacterium]